MPVELVRAFLDRALKARNASRFLIATCIVIAAIASYALYRLREEHEATQLFRSRITCNSLADQYAKTHSRTGTDGVDRIYEVREFDFSQKRATCVAIMDVSILIRTDLFRTERQTKFSLIDLGIAKAIVWRDSLQESEKDMGDYLAGKDVKELF